MTTPAAAPLSDPDRTARAIQGDTAVRAPVAELRQGVITAVDNGTGRCDVALGGDTTSIPAVSRLANYRPLVGDTCYALVNGPDVIVLDRPADLYDRGQLADRTVRTTSIETTATSRTSAAQVLTSGSVPVKAGRAYLALCPQVPMYMDDNTVIGVMGAQLTYTTNGSAPSAGSTMLCAVQCIVGSSQIVASTSVGSIYRPVSDHTWRVALSIWRALPVDSSDGGAFGSWGIELNILDVGY